MSLSLWVYMSLSLYVSLSMPPPLPGNQVGLRWGGGGAGPSRFAPPVLHRPVFNPLYMKLSCICILQYLNPGAPPGNLNRISDHADVPGGARSSSLLWGRLRLHLGCDVTTSGSTRRVRVPTEIGRRHKLAVAPFPLTSPGICLLNMADVLKGGGLQRSGCCPSDS